MKLNPSIKDSPVYVGIQSHISSLGSEKNDKEKKNGDKENGDKKIKENKNVRSVEDGLLLVVSARIHGKAVRALIDSSATRCFVAPSCIGAIGLRSEPHDIFLELGNNKKFLSQGYVPEVPVVTAGLTVKIGLTVANLLHEVDLVLGINWL